MLQSTDCRLLEEHEGTTVASYNPPMVVRTLILPESRGHRLTSERAALSDVATRGKENGTCGFQPFVKSTKVDDDPSLMSRSSLPKKQQEPSYELD